jgi:aminotransferase
VNAQSLDMQRLIAKRARSIDASGIRRVFDLGAKLKNPINLSIGQPDFAVPDPIKEAAVEAIQCDRNGYTPTQGVAPLRARLNQHLADDVGWKIDGDQTSMLVTSGTSGALTLAFMALLDPGDEAIIPDPYFVAYPHLARLCGGYAIRASTYPDFVMTAERVEPHISDKTKFVLFNSPSNPAGAVATEAQCRDLLDLCRRKNILLISDEIYDEFTYSESRTATSPGGRTRCPSPARFADAQDDVLLVRGFGKSYSTTGWRMGYAAGPKPIIDEMAKLQQYTFVCAPAMAQWGSLAALDVDLSEHVARYEKRRDMVVQKLSPYTTLATPGGAFYAFPEVPPRLGRTATEFVERAADLNVLIIPGNVFSDCDTHFRLSFATNEASLETGLDVLAMLMQS